MAATYRASFKGGGTLGMGQRTCVFTPAVGDLLVVFAILSQTPDDAPDVLVTDNQGGTYTLVPGTRNCRPSTSPSKATAVYIRDSLVTSAVSHTVRANDANAENTSGELVVIAVSGVLRVGTAGSGADTRPACVRSYDGIHANVGTSELNAGSSAPSATFPASCLSDNMTLGAVFDLFSSVTPPTDWTERQEGGQVTPSCGLEVVTRDSGFSGDTITWGNNVTNWGCCVIEITGDAP